MDNGVDKCETLKQLASVKQAFMKRKDKRTITNICPNVLQENGDIIRGQLQLVFIFVHSE